MEVIILMKPSLRTYGKTLIPRCQTCGSLDGTVAPLPDGELMCNRCFDAEVTKWLAVI